MALASGTVAVHLALIASGVKEKFAITSQLTQKK